MAAAYGADAVYLAGTTFGMRSFAGNFTPEALKEAVELCHRRGIRSMLPATPCPETMRWPACRSGWNIWTAWGWTPSSWPMWAPCSGRRPRPPCGAAHLHPGQCGQLPVRPGMAPTGGQAGHPGPGVSLDEIREIRDKTPPELDDQLEEAAAKEAAEEPAEAEPGPPTL